MVQWNSKHSNTNLLFLVPMEICIQLSEGNWYGHKYKANTLGRSHIINNSSKMSSEISEIIAKKDAKVTVECSLKLLATSTIMKTKAKT